jgi:RNA polymerase sigma-70 factor (ECF subfamily)
MWKSDSELLSEYRNGDAQKAIGLIFSKHKAFVMGVCMQTLHDVEESKDATMQVFERLISDLQRFDIQHFTSWLYAYTRNHCLQTIRKREAEKNHQTFMETPFVWHPTDVEPDEIRFEQLDNALHTIPHDQQACIRLFFLEGKSYAQISNETGYTLNQVKSHIQNGKRNLLLRMNQRHG